MTMENLDQFRIFAIAREKQKKIKGGDAAYCTNNKCYKYFMDAYDDCMRDPTCNSIQVCM